jgi:single-strand DNA-binding protein
MQLIGLCRLGRDAELRSTSTGDHVANLSLAFNYGKKGADGKKPTQWVDATLWGRMAESLSPYCTRGKSLHVTIDDAHIESFTKPDGTTATKLTGRVSNLEFAGDAQAGQRRSRNAKRPNRLTTSMTSTQTFHSD